MHTQSIIPVARSNRKRLAGCFLIAFMTLICGTSYAAPTKITIMHTNDMHSHLLGFGPEADYTPLSTNDDITVGGFARLAAEVTAIRAARPATNPTLLVDAGDFMMGTAFTLLRGKAELTLMDLLGYDVITIGNHEFDWGPAETAKIYGLISGTPPLHMQVVASNLIFSDTSPKDDALAALYGTDNVIKPYWIKEIDGFKVGFFGLLGEDATSVAPFASPVTFEDQSTAAAAAVTALQAAGAQLIVCLSHSGLEEDSALAAAVPGINVIISGHTHEKTTIPITAGTTPTLIVQAGSYGRYLGVLDLTINSGVASFDAYDLVDIDDTITGDTTIQAAVEGLKGEINTVLSSVLGYLYTFDQIIATTPYDLVGVAGEETNLGNLVTDAMRWMVDQVEYDPADPTTKVDLAVESNGVIRDDILKGTSGQISFSDAFRVLPLGFGLENDDVGNPLVGYPMVTIYVTAAEVRKALEVITTVYPLKGSDYWLSVSGLKFEYNPNLIPFYRVRRIYMGDEVNGYDTTPLDTSCLNKNLYKIAINYYVAQFIAVIGDYTYGFLTIVPKDKDGVSYLDETVHPNGLDDARVDRLTGTPGVQELQEWEGFVRYLHYLGTVPDRYEGPEGRIKETTCFIRSVAL